MNITDTTLTIGCASPGRDKATCPYCGAELQYLTFGALRLAQPCDCEGARLHQERRRSEQERRKREDSLREFRERLEASGLSLRGRECTFARFVVSDGSKAAYHSVLEFLQWLGGGGQADASGKTGVLLMGCAGVGKTFLACAAANDVLRRGGRVLFTTAAGMLSDIKRSFVSEGGEYEATAKYMRTKLLILDDLGKEQATDWAQSKLFDVINERYENYRPLIVTTNYSMAALVERLTPRSGDGVTGSAIVSRLVEMCRVVGITGNDRRLCGEIVASNARF